VILIWTFATVGGIMRPYIGITDFTTSEQVDLLMRYFEDYPNTKRMLHVGVMTSYKQLHGLPSKWQNVFPKSSEIADIFQRDDVYNCLHYADYDGHPGLRQTLGKAIISGGPKLHSLQLDMIWPDPDAIRSAIEDTGNVTDVILQINKFAMGQCQEQPHLVARRLKSYQGIVTRVLLDKSMGRGAGLDARLLTTYARAIVETIPEIGLGVAGGLGPSTLYLLDPLIKAFPNISIDAQSRLRPSGSALAEPIDWDMAGLYLKRSIEYFAANA